MSRSEKGVTEIGGYFAGIASGRRVPVGPVPLAVLLQLKRTPCKLRRTTGAPSGLPMRMHLTCK